MHTQNGGRVAAQTGTRWRTAVPRMILAEVKAAEVQALDAAGAAAEAAAVAEAVAADAQLAGTAKQEALLRAEEAEVFQVRQHPLL